MVGAMYPSQELEWAALILDGHMRCPLLTDDHSSRKLDCSHFQGQAAHAGRRSRGSIKIPHLVSPARVVQRIGYVFKELGATECVQNALAERAESCGVDICSEQAFVCFALIITGRP